MNKKKYEEKLKELRELEKENKKLRDELKIVELRLRTMHDNLHLGILSQSENKEKK